MKKEMMRIMSAASGVFATEGLRAASIEMICQACGVRKREFYIYFEGKEALINDIITQWISVSGKQLRMIPSLSFNAITEAQAFFSFVEKMMAELSPGIMADLQVYYTEQCLRLNYFRDTEVFPFLVRNVERGIMEGVYKDGIDKLLTGRLYALQIKAVCIEPALLAEMHRIFLQGILSGKGLKQLQ
jgi:AcrR family transcriptional regulator